MTRLRKMMLDELERRNYSQNTRNYTCTLCPSALSIFTARPTSLGSITYATTKRACFENAN